MSAGIPFYSSPVAPRAPALSRFLDAGPPPVVFTLGSFVTHAAGDFYVEAAALARRLGRRAILLAGRHATARYRSIAGDDVLIAGEAPHAALFPRAAAVIHHGGIGTTAQRLRAGLPHLVCPFFGDQFDNAAHLERLAAGISVPLRQFSAQRGAVPFAALLRSPAAAVRARELAEGVGNDRGPAIAATAIAVIAGSQADRASFA